MIDFNEELNSLVDLWNEMYPSAPILPAPTPMKPEVMNTFAKFAGPFLRDKVANMFHAGDD